MVENGHLTCNYVHDLAAWDCMQITCQFDGEETDVLFNLLSYARTYWRKSLDRKTTTQADGSKMRACIAFCVMYFWTSGQAALDLQAVMKHNPRNARPSKRKCALAGSGGPKQAQLQPEGNDSSSIKPLSKPTSCTCRPSSVGDCKQQRGTRTATHGRCGKGCPSGHSSGSASGPFSKSSPRKPAGTCGLGFFTCRFSCMCDVALHGVLHRKVDDNQRAFDALQVCVP